ncbi:MAG: hypothetical protein K2K48_03795 [Anaeroplasmataceae bacterium]|nr:hypothetical protein [Anaeroplasmataceae bacterium]
MSYNLRKNLAHLGTIFFRFSFFGLICLLGLLVSEILVLLILLVLLMMALLTLFTILLDEGFRNLLDVTSSFSELFMVAKSYIPTVVAISLAFLFVAILCLLPDYKNKATRTKLIFSICLAIVFVVLLIIGLKGGGVDA